MAPVAQDTSMRLLAAPLVLLLVLPAFAQEDDPFGAREALFTTGRKDLETAKKWASSQEYATPILERVIDGLVNMDSKFLLDRIRSILEQGKGA